VIGRAAALNSRRFGDDLEACLERGALTEALALSHKVRTPAGRAAEAALVAWQRSAAMVPDRVDATAAAVLPPLSRRLPHLSLLANVATLLGLLGTIFGLTTAFSAVSAADPAARSTFLAAGISQALNTTSFGVIIAVPAMILHGLLAAKVESIGEQIDTLGLRLHAAFLRREDAARSVATSSERAA